MADIKVSELTEATSGVNSSDILYLVQSGSSKKATVANVVSNARIDARIGAAYLSNLYDVSGLTPSNAQVLTWNSVTSLWEPQAGGGFSEIAGVSSGTVSNVQLAKAINSQSIGNVTLSYANVRNLTFTDNAVNFYNAFSGTSFGWVENVLGRDGYFSFYRKGTERAYITADGWPVADAAAGQNTIPTFKSANSMFVANADPCNAYIGNITIYSANVGGLVLTSNLVQFHNKFSGLSMYWYENALARDGYWAFARSGTDRAYITVDGYPVADAAAGQNTIPTFKTANATYVVATAAGTGQQVGNLTLRWSNVNNMTFTDNAISFFKPFSGTSFYWSDTVGFPANKNWGFDEAGVNKAKVSSSGYILDQDTLISAKQGNVIYLKNDGGSSALTPGGWSANAYSLSANVFSFRYGNHTGSVGAYFYNDVAAGGFRYYWPGTGASGSVGLGLDGVHFNSSLLEDPSGTSSQVYRGDGTIGAVPSDVNLKRSVAPSTVGLDFIKALDVKTFEMRNSTVNEDAGYGPKMIGFIAQDVYNAANNYVDMNPIISDRRGYLGIDVNQIVAALVNAVKTLSDEVDQLKNR